VGAWIRRSVLTQEDAERRDRAQRRHEFYGGGGDRRMADFIARVFRDRDVIAKRQAWVESSKHANPLRRLIVEGATLYAVPARRTVADPEGQRRYSLLQRMCRQDELALCWSRWGMLHNNLLLGMRVRRTERERVPLIDIIDPGHFWVLPSPVDPTRLLAVGIEIGREMPRGDDRDPYWLVCSDYEQGFLTKGGRVISESFIEHGWPRMPYLLLSVEPPHGQLLDSMTGENAVAAHMQIWFQHILLAKEAKSATKIPVIAGDATVMARQQAADSEVPVEAPDGTVISAVDLGMDLSQFRATAQYIYESVAADHGLSPGLLHHQGVQSAEARELMRAPLKEQRRMQEIYYRELERQFVEIQSMVLARQMPELAFSTEGWRIDFGESSTALDPKAQLELFEHKRRLGLTDTVVEMIRANPDLDYEAAMRELAEHVEVELTRNALMRPLQQISGSMGETWAEEVDATGSLVRSGFEPTAAARAMGLDVTHTGAAPITVQQTSTAPPAFGRRPPPGQ
jgi:hypothetical protein